MNTCRRISTPAFFSVETKGFHMISQHFSPIIGFLEIEISVWLRFIFFNWGDIKWHILFYGFIGLFYVFHPNRNLNQKLNVNCNCSLVWFFLSLQVEEATMVMEDDSPAEQASTPGTLRNLSAWSITIPYIDIYEDEIKREKIPVFCIDVERNDRKEGEWTKSKKQTAPVIRLVWYKVIGVESFNSTELLLTHRENTDMGFCSNTLFGMFLAFVAVAH